MKVHSLPRLEETRSSIEDERAQGRRTILGHIRRAGSIARVDVAEQTRISRPTVTTITASLLREGIIEEVETPKVAGARGRPRTNLRLRGEAFLVVGVTISERKTSMVIVDFNGVMVGEYSITSNNENLAPQALHDHIVEAVKNGVAAQSLMLNDLAAIAVGLPGMCDGENGVIYWSPLLSENNLPIGATLTEALGVPTFIENDANTVAMAEHLFGRATQLNNFIIVTIDNGLGMGVVINGKLYRGARGCGAEFGHTKVQFDGALCRCGQRGCLEAYVADYGLLREYRAAFHPREETSQAEQLAHLLGAGADGDRAARSVLERSSRMFAMGLANLVNLFDPEMIIISGESLQLNHLFAQDVRDHINTFITQIDNAPQLEVHRWDRLMWARGAAALALDHVIERIALNA